MENITYQNIKELIQEEYVENEQLIVKFKTPSSDKMIEAVVMIGDIGITSTHTRDYLKGTLWTSILNMVHRVFQKDKANNPDYNNAPSKEKSSIKFSAKEKENAVIEAFKSVSHFFYWNEDDKTWISLDTEPYLIQELIKNPIQTQYDKEILARILVEIAEADGKLMDVERKFLFSFLPKEFDDLDSLKEMPPLKKNEIQKLSPEAHSVAYILKWALSLADTEIAKEETKKIGEISAYLNLNEAEKEQLKEAAQFYILEGFIARKMPQEDLWKVAERINVSREGVAKAVELYQKRLKK